MIRCHRPAFVHALRVVLLAGMLLLAGRRTTAYAHPIHSTMTDITIDERRATLRIMIRVFAGDFGTAVTLGQAEHPAMAGESVALGYVRRSLVLLDGDRPVPLRFCGTRRAAEVRWICMEASVPARRSGLRLGNTIMTNLFADQVNIVRSMVDGAPRSLMFTRGDGAKPLN
ncbi:MAG: hypothetical protein H0W68_04980 [Gemmatimonadaceae bacterium]|nr:hypothetical protein [Gemmatimonadaceae bacterium]